MIIGTLFVALLILLFMGFPIAVALALSCVFAMLVDGTLPMALVAQRMFMANSSFSMLAVPFFMLAGSIMTAGGISKRLVDFSSALIGWVSGGLAMTATATSMFFAAISGSSSATCAAVGSSLIPEMEKKGYPKDFSGAVCASAATTGIVIPPSVSMVLYAVAVGVSVGDLFMAGILPGILMGLAIMVVIYLVARKRAFPSERWQGVGVIFTRFVQSFWGLLTPAIIIGGIYGGIFTATEAAAASVVYALFASAVIYRDLRLSQIPDIILDAAKATAIVMFIMNAAGLFSWILTANQVPQLATQFFLSVSNNKYVMLLLVNILLLVVGTFLNASSAVIILAPILVPVMKSLGVDPVLFGIIMIVNLAIGTITPPVGVSLFVAQSITGNTLGQIFKATIPYLLALLLVLLLVTYIPAISLFLPSLFK